MSRRSTVPPPTTTINRQPTALDRRQAGRQAEPQRMDRNSPVCIDRGLNQRDRLCAAHEVAMAIIVSCRGMSSVMKEKFWIITRQQRA